MEITLTDQNFDEEINKTTVPVLVDFYATWCGPCKMLAPILEEIATEMAGKVIVGKVDVDQNPNVSQKYGVMSIPTLIIFKNGEIVKQMVGYQGKENLTKELDLL